MNSGINYEQDLVPSNRFDTFLERLAEKVGLNVKASLVFAEPVERDGVTVIPVAKVRWGFGGGAGAGQGSEREAGAGSGAGGGGGVMASPIGYIELANGQSRFRPLSPFYGLAPVILAGRIAFALVARGLARTVRESRRGK